ncbi:ankyrin repeat domain-containing protein [Modestobacter sp. I12A-02662]|uniref:ankyrin repeat domain-containing protein n=1 Tax=Modestobacter sp. I12A-02662 TaxID=1730496 RepID=UPI0034DE7AD8
MTADPSTPRMTATRLARLVADGDAEAVRAAVTAQPRLLAEVVERDGDGGWTPLHQAVLARSDALVRLLVEAGADPAARTDGGRSPLHLALEHAPELVAVLRELGAPVDAASAAFLDDAEQLATALDGGAPLTDPSTDVDLLSWAACGGATEAVDLLLTRGAHPGAALHVAAAAGSAPVVHRLLGAGAAVDVRDPATGRTPLHSAVASAPDEQVLAMVRLLLGAGADVDAVTQDGASALDIARVAGARRRAASPGRDPVSETLVEVLVAAGASG